MSGMSCIVTPDLAGYVRMSDLPSAVAANAPVRSVNAATGDVTLTIPNTTGLATTTAVGSAIAALAPATAPPAVADASVLGTSSTYARADHTHVSSVFKAVKVTTDSSGTVTWSYPANFFLAAPVIELTVEDSGSQAFIPKITSNTAAGGSAKIIASQILPSLTPLSVSAILTGVIAGVNAIVSAMTGYNVFGGSVPVGTKVHIFAAKATVVP